MRKTSQDYRIFFLILVCIFSASCNYFCGKVEPPETITTLSSETEALLANKSSAISWGDANEGIRCHFIYSESCKKIEEEKGIKIDSHIIRCTKIKDLQFSKSGGFLYQYEDVEVSKALNIGSPNPDKIASGLLYEGTFRVTPKTYIKYEIATKSQVENGYGLGLPANTFSVWYKENPMTKKGQWECDLCRSKYQFVAPPCEKVQEITDFIRNVK